LFFSLSRALPLGILRFKNDVFEKKWLSVIEVRVLQPTGLASKPKFELGPFLWDSQSVLVWPDECRDGEVLEFPNQDPNMETLILMN
jgi:hypothetical protein